MAIFYQCVIWNHVQCGMLCMCLPRLTSFATYFKQLHKIPKGTSMCMMTISLHKIPKGTSMCMMTIL